MTSEECPRHGEYILWEVVDDDSDWGARLTCWTCGEVITDESGEIMDENREPVPDRTVDRKHKETHDATPRA